MKNLEHVLIGVIKLTLKNKLSVHKLMTSQNKVRRENSQVFHQFWVPFDASEQIRSTTNFCLGHKLQPFYKVYFAKFSRKPFQISCTNVSWMILSLKIIHRQTCPSGRQFLAWKLGWTWLKWYFYKWSWMERTRLELKVN